MKQEIFEEKYGVERLNSNCTKWDGLEEKFGEKKSHIYVGGRYGF